jgi:hypothetical protein
MFGCFGDPWRAGIHEPLILAVRIDVETVFTNARRHHYGFPDAWQVVFGHGRWHLERTSVLTPDARWAHSALKANDWPNDVL